MSTFSQLIDSDWARLSELAGNGPGNLKFRNLFSARFAPVVLIRIAQSLHASGWHRAAKLFALANFVFFGIEVPPRIPIGAGLLLMHTQGTVLGAAVIGANVTLYHQVTLGAVAMDFAYTPTMRPVVGDGVIIGVGAKVLGQVTLGDQCVIGANAVVLRDVPPRHRAVGVPAKNLAPRT